jgi:hypothetical protein
VCVLLTRARAAGEAHHLGAQHLGTQPKPRIRAHQQITNILNTLIHMQGHSYSVALSFADLADGKGLVNDPVRIDIRANGALHAWHLEHIYQAGGEERQQQWTQQAPQHPS